MNKTSSIVVAVIIVLFLVGLAYLAGRNSVTDSTSGVEVSSVAPDGSEIKGPSGMPDIDTHTLKEDPRQQSQGPVVPPPTN